MSRLRSEDRFCTARSHVISVDRDSGAYLSGEINLRAAIRRWDPFQSRPGFQHRLSEILEAFGRQGYEDCTEAIEACDLAFADPSIPVIPAYTVTLADNLAAVYSEAQRLAPGCVGILVRHDSEETEILRLSERPRFLDAFEALPVGNTGITWIGAWQDLFS